MNKYIVTPNFLSNTTYDFEERTNSLKIYRNRNTGILGLSQQAYIDKVLKRYEMQHCKPGNTPVAKGDKLSLSQCPKTEPEKQEMHQIPYASVVGSLMYAQVCTRPDIAYITGVLGRYLSNPGMIIGKQPKGYYGTYRERRILCLLIGNQKSLRSLGILIPILRAVKIA